MALGERLKKARNDKGLTQVEAAKILGVTNGALSGYERNYRDPDTKMLKEIAELYEVSIDYLIGNENVSKNNQAVSTEKDERDIAKRMAELREDLSSATGLLFDGEPMSDEAKDSLLEAMEFGVRLAKKNNKKYIPKKYRDDKE